MCSHGSTGFSFGRCGHQTWIPKFIVCSVSTSLIAAVILSVQGIVVGADAARGTPWKSMCLGQIRSMLLGETVRVQGLVTHSPLTGNVLLDWSVAEADGEFYRSIWDVYQRDLRDSYLGLTAQVIAVQLNRIDREKLNVGSVNALGEAVSDSSIVNPYCDVVVRFADGTLAMTSSYPTLMFDPVTNRPFQLETEHARRVAAIGAGLPEIAGATVYAVAYSELFPATSSLDAMLEIQETTHLLEFPRLEPFEIAVAKYDEIHDVVVLKLRDVEGTEYLTASAADMSGHKTFLEAVASSYPCFLLIAQPHLTAKELEAVHAGHIFRGMSRDALEYAIGLADKENDWGQGGRQLIYFGGRIMVYVGEGDRVQDWQSLHE